MEKWVQNGQVSNIEKVLVEGQIAIKINQKKNKWNVGTG